MSAVVILAAASCNKEQPTFSPETAPKTFTASVDGADTKTVIEGNLSYWNGVEAIRVLDGTNYKLFESYEPEKTATTEFVEKNASDVLTENDYLAIYPASQAGYVTWSGNVSDPIKNMWLKDYQATVADSYDSDAHVSLAYTQAGSDILEFKNVVSILKLTVGNDEVGDIIFEGNNGEYIAGNFNVAYNNGDPEVDFEGVDPANIKTRIFLRGPKEKEQTYYFSVLPAHFSDGFKVEFLINTVSYSKKASAEFTIGRNQIIDLGRIEFDVDPITYKTLYMRPSSIWENKSPKAYAAWSFVSGGDGGWFMGTDSDKDGIYEFLVPEDNDMVVFTALKSETPDWGYVHYQTVDLEVPDTDENACVIMNSADVNGHNNAEWMTLTEAKAYVPAEQCSIFVKNDLGWGNVNMVIDNIKIAMTPTTIGDVDYYVAEIEKGSTYDIVFNNGNTSNDWMIECNDITVDCDKYFRLSARGAIAIDPNDVTTFGYTIYVFDQKSKNIAPNLYVWEDDNAFNNSYGSGFSSWPGKVFTNDCYYIPANKESWKHYYYCVIPSSLYGSSFKFIVDKKFKDKQGDKEYEQTSDLKVTDLESDLYVGYWNDGDNSFGFWTNANLNEVICN